MILNVSNIDFTSSGLVAIEDRSFGLVLSTCYESLLLSSRQDCLLNNHSVNLPYLYRQYLCHCYLSNGVRLDFFKLEEMISTSLDLLCYYYIIYFIGLFLNNHF